MKKINCLLLTAILLLLSGCSSGGQVMDGDGIVNSYTQISQEAAKEMMAQDDGHIIVDVRRQDEYDAGHIPGAILIPNESIGTEQPEELRDLDQIILIYCRSGNRSKQAAQKLFDMGYTNIYEFGGIIDWTGEIAKEEAEENTSEPADSEASTNTVEQMLITITVGGHVITATLYDNAAGRALWDKLPLTLNMMNLYGREMCYRFGAGGLAADDVAECAEVIASHCNLNPERAYILGLLHDVGRRAGIGQLKHVYYGWKHMNELGYPAVAKVCLTHSYNTHRFEDDMAKIDVSPEQADEVKAALAGYEYDDYDRLIQLCDSIATAEGVVDAVERMTDVKTRYGSYPQTKWNKNIELLEYFREKTGRDVYELCRSC